VRTEINKPLWNEPPRQGTHRTQLTYLS